MDAQLLDDSCFLAKLREMLSFTLYLVNHDAQMISLFIIVDFIDCVHQLFKLLGSMHLAEFRLTIDQLF